jgi:hypothetical protein
LFWFCLSVCQHKQGKRKGCDKMWQYLASGEYKLNHFDFCDLWLIISKGSLTSNPLNNSYFHPYFNPSFHPLSSTFWMKTKIQWGFEYQTFRSGSWMTLHMKVQRNGSNIELDWGLIYQTM